MARSPSQRRLQRACELRAEDTEKSNGRIVAAEDTIADFSRYAAWPSQLRAQETATHSHTHKTGCCSARPLRPYLLDNPSCAEIFRRSSRRTPLLSPTVSSTGFAVYWTEATRENKIVVLPSSFAKLARVEGCLQRSLYLRSPWPLATLLNPTALSLSAIVFP